jgi:hypothetical protein
MKRKIKTQRRRDAEKENTKGKKQKESRVFPFFLFPFKSLRS